MQNAATARPSPSVLWRYGLPVVLVAAALGLAILLERMFSTRFWFLFLAAVMAGAWFGGKGPAWLAVILSTVAVDRYLLPPFHPWKLNLEDISFSVTFAACALLAGWVSSTRRQTEASLKEARDELEGKVEERTAELWKANNALLTEMAERKRVEDKMRLAQAELAHLSRVLMMGELAASIAHEVSQPLTAVVTNGNACLRWLAGETANLEEARAAAERIVRDGNRASEVIQRIRTLLKKAPPQMVRLDLNELIREVIGLASNEIAKNRVELRTQLGSDVPPVLGDRVQLQQVVLNLMMNGIEAMNAAADGPRNLQIGTRKHEPDLVCVWVRDSGVGIPPENLAKLSTAFFTTKPGGMGMGLSISRSIIEAHCGKLWAGANSDSGTTFQFTLPTAGKSTP